MVDFAKHCKNPPKEKDPNTITGTLTGWIKRRGTGKVTQRECEWEIRLYPSLHGAWVAFWITKGGVTGYESFIIDYEEGKGLNDHALDRIFRTDPKGYWSACAGGVGWDEMRIQNQELRDAIQQWLDREGLTYPEKE
ncbi:hypothetical protein LCGC14_2883370 [marine sediment metagenome]|uniref:Uncharacterized protein n=1 Tax=marine sediment metagenome TaxID=412755 RepID=A0A0F8YL82_9ZZZZ